MYLGLHRGLAGKFIQNLKEKFQSAFPEENAARFGRFIRQIPEGAERKLERNVNGTGVFLAADDEQQLAHVLGRRSQDGRLRRGDLGCQNGADGHAHPPHRLIIKGAQTLEDESSTPISVERDVLKDSVAAQGQ